MEGVPATSVAFEAVKPKKASTLIAEQILKLLEAGQLRPGDRLPPERRLAEEFAVNRQAVREALSALQLLGVVETRPGAGTRIPRGMPKGADLLSEVRHLDEQDNPFEVMEARAVIEPEIVRLAAGRATDSQLRDILAAINVYEQLVRNNTPPISGDLAIHSALAGASGNAVFAGFIQSIASLANQWLWRRRREQEWEQQRALLYLEQHRRIYAAIKGHHAAEAVRAMKLHLRATQDLLEGHPRSTASKVGNPPRSSSRPSS